MENEKHGALTLDVMLFRVNGALFGVKVDQIMGVYGQHRTASENERISRLDEIFFGHASPVRENWKIIRLKEAQKDGSFWGFLTEEPEDMIKISIVDIRPLPSMVEKLGAFKSIWGSFHHGEELGLLLDLTELCWETTGKKAA
ncbi:MAG: hypothetical protein HY280_09355 [Nitrospinae bacterium]|nr:hypothetical protein [Nitrospinota bacterium]